MNRILFFIIFLFLNSSVSIASVQDSLTVKTDTSRIDQRAFSADLSEKYTGPEYDYNTIEGTSMNFIARAISWFFGKIENLFGVQISPGLYQVLEFIIYAICIILVVYLILRLLMGTRANAIFRGKISEVAPLNIQEEHIEKVDLQKLIDEALKQNNFRLAIRYMYLQSLQLLSQKQIISWHFEKTNSDYQREIQHPELKDTFKQISYLYDYVWYGEFEITDQGFSKAKSDFDRFTQNIKYAG